MKTSKIFQILRLTTVSTDMTAKIKNNVLPQRALNRLKQYEDTGLSPSEIINLIETNKNLEKRIKKLEGW